MMALTRKQLEVLEAVNRGDEFAGNWRPELDAAIQLADKGLLIRASGRVCPWRLTVVGRRVLKEAVERAAE
jgi:hypothetical protein